MSAATTLPRLGKAPYRHDPRTLRASRYLATTPAPASCDWSGKTGPLGDMLNNRLGCCAIASPGHQIQVWTSQAASAPVVLPDSAIKEGYERIGNYDPRDPSSDQGCVLLDVMKAWHTDGIGGHKIEAFALIEVADINRMKLAICTFGGVSLGAQLPISAQGAAAWNTIDRGPNGAKGSWGGHAIPGVGYGDKRPPQIVAYTEEGFWVISWGQLLFVSWAWWLEYGDECWLMVSRDWLSAQGMSPGGVDLAGLLADAAECGTLAAGAP